MLLRLDSGYFVAGVVVEERTVVRAAPIVKYMVRWNKQEVFRYCERKQWICEKILSNHRY